MTRTDMPSIGKNVSASYSSLPVSDVAKPCPGFSDQRASCRLTTNQPSETGKRPPASVGSSFASGTSGIVAARPRDDLLRADRQASDRHAVGRERVLDRG